MKKSLILSLALLILSVHQGMAKELPNVLIMGDSISIGYSPYVIENLKGVAEVRRHKGNAGPTIRGVAGIEEWLGKEKWDLIHFNWGLWDMYGWEYHKEDRSPEAYGTRLELLVGRLKKTGAKLIWATTTPACPANEITMARRFKQDIRISPELERKYLEAALAVMKKNGVEVNDLHAFMKPQWTKYAIADNNVHFTKLGSQKLGEQVAKAIRSALSFKTSGPKR
jgi:acyl-CoA thioesterase-1